MNNIDYNRLKDKALRQLKNGDSLFGKDGAFTPMLKEFLEEALQAEMDSHLDIEARSSGNKRNGLKSKTIKSHQGDFEIDTPQDRLSTFEPEIVKKRQTILADNLQNKIIALYGRGNSLRDIASYIKEMYDTDISHTTLSQITDRIIPMVKQWQNRPLEKVYPIVFLDAIHFKVHDQGKVITKAAYSILGINTEGKKDILGIYISENEGANFWLNALTQLKNRGVEDMLIVCIDGLSGFAEAINSVYPKAEIQRCIIHQIRNSLKYVASKDQKEFMVDLKKVYKAETKETAENALIELSVKWEKKYPIVIKSWQNNWEKLSTFFNYTPEIRKIIYTTNAVEGYHRQIRKVTKTKGSFPNEMGLLKLIYLATMNIKKKWKAPIPNWGLIAQQLAIRFEGRMPLQINVDLDR